MQIKWQDKIRLRESPASLYDSVKFNLGGAQYTMNWFAKINGQVYGPYSDQHMHGFVAEGRITAQSQISNAPASGFFDAISFDIFSFWSGSGQITHMPQAVSGGGQSYGLHSAAAPSTAKPASLGGGYSEAYIDHSAKAPTGITPAAPSLIDNFAAPDSGRSKPQGDPTVIVIMAEIRSDDGVAFSMALNGFGPTERIGDSVWLLKTAANAQELRNRLSQALSRQDRMFIVGSAQDQSAWFNIGADLDHRIRALWES